MKIHDDLPHPDEIKPKQVTSKRSEPLPVTPLKTSLRTQPSQDLKEKRVSKLNLNDPKSELVAHVVEVRNSLIENVRQRSDLTAKDKKNYIKLVEERCAEHVRSLDDFGYFFQQHYFALNVQSSTSTIDRILDNSVPDRAVVSYLDELIRFKNSPNISQDERNRIETSIKKMQESLAVSLMVTLIISSPKKDKSVEKSILQTYLVEKMKKLDVGEELMIPSGFMRGSTRDVINALKKDEAGHPLSFGHAIFVQCKKLQSDEFEFTIFNTGLGHEHHETEFGRVIPLRYKAALDSQGVEVFCQDLVNCSHLPLSEKNPSDRFYSCFKNFTKVAWNSELDVPLFTLQNIDNCTQFSIRAFLKTQLGNTLHAKFDKFFIEDTERKCEDYIQTLDKKHHNYMSYYKHPALKPKNFVHFLQIWIFSCLYIDNKVKLKESQLAFGISKAQLQQFVSDSKKARQKQLHLSNPPYKKAELDHLVSEFERLAALNHAFKNF